MKVACLTVIYPGMEEYLNDYIDCIQAQTFQDFELIVVDEKCPLRVADYLARLDIPTHVLEHAASPLQNRLLGLNTCRELGFDIVVCSDSDETMYPDRIAKNIAYFESHDDQMVYNNSVAHQNGRSFDLHLKDRIELTDVLDYNVLGYGALSLRGSIIPFIFEHANEKVSVFDWWLGLIYLLHFRYVDFLPEVCNRYRCHSGNAIGPVFDVKENRIEVGIGVKSDLYTQLVHYCAHHGFEAQARLFEQKLLEILEIKEFIKNKSLAHYAELVQDYLSGFKKIFWWQDVVPLIKLKEL